MWIDVVVPVIPALGKLRQEDSMFKVSLAHTGRLWVFFKVVFIELLQNLCGICIVVSPSWVGMHQARGTELYAGSLSQEEHLKALLLVILKRRFLPHHNGESH